MGKRGAKRGHQDAGRKVMKSGEINIFLGGGGRHTDAEKRGKRENNALPPTTPPTPMKTSSTLRSPNSPSKWRPFTRSYSSAERGE